MGSWKGELSIIDVYNAIWFIQDSEQPIVSLSIWKEYDDHPDSEFRKSFQDRYEDS